MNSVREHTWATVSVQFYTGGCSLFPSAFLGSFTEEMFEVTSCYFPIDFTPVSPCLLSSRADESRQDSSDNVVSSSSSADDISVCMPLKGHLFIHWRKPAVITVFRYDVLFWVMQAQPSNIEKPFNEPIFSHLSKQVLILLHLLINWNLTNLVFDGIPIYLKFEHYLCRYTPSADF